MGVWISGFFDSGQSSFAKNLGYALQNRKVMDQDFSTLFKEAIHDEKVTNLLDSINARIPTKVVLLNFPNIGGRGLRVRQRGSRREVCGSWGRCCVVFGLFVSWCAALQWSVEGDENEGDTRPRSGEVLIEAVCAAASEYQ